MDAQQILGGYLMNEIELINISKTYTGNNTAAVKDFSLVLKEGEIATLLGPSGCGKTTTLRIMAGFERPDSGIIKIGEKVVFEKNHWIPPERRNIGMVFQDYALFPHLNVFNNVGFGYNKRDKRMRIQEVLELVGLLGFEKRYPHELSGGQQQRVAIARALTRRPVVVLLDEPFSNLDADLRICMRVDVKRIIKEAGATAVFVSHDQKDALAISDKIVVIKEGRIQQVGSPKEIYQNPKNSYVATFVGQTNLITGEIIDKNRVITGLGEIKLENDHQFSSGDKVKVSIRPDSFAVDTEGDIEGKLISTVYGGDIIDTVIEINNPSKQKIMLNLKPDQGYTLGDTIKLKILPKFVAVLSS